jgi:hypothetical membrane protein
MNQRFLSLCGIIAPVLFVFMTILGAALRPGYSHISDTVSELFSPGSPNKPLLDTLHTTFALLLTLFGIGVLQFVRRSGQSTLTGIIGASLYLTAGVLSIATATIFPQDPSSSPPTFTGQMHINLTGMVGLLSMLSILLLGLWFSRTKLFPWFGIYSFITVGLVILSAVFFMAMMGTPIMGLTERITVLVGFTWTFILARWMFTRQEKTG